MSAAASLQLTGGNRLAVSMATKRTALWSSDPLLLDLFVKHEVSLGVFIYHNSGHLYTAVQRVNQPVARGPLSSHCGFTGVLYWCGVWWAGLLVQRDVGLLALRPQGQAALLQLGLGVVPVLVQNELLQHTSQA